MAGVFRRICCGRRNNQCWKIFCQQLDVRWQSRDMACSKNVIAKFIVRSSSSRTLLGLVALFSNYQTSNKLTQWCPNDWNMGLPVVSMCSIFSSNTEAYQPHQLLGSHKGGISCGSKWHFLKLPWRKNGRNHDSESCQCEEINPACCLGRLLAWEKLRKIWNIWRFY